MFLQLWKFLKVIARESQKVNPSQALDRVLRPMAKTQRHGEDVSHGQLKHKGKGALLAQPFQGPRKKTSNFPICLFFQLVC